MNENMDNKFCFLYFNSKIHEEMHICKTAFTVKIKKITFITDKYILQKLLQAIQVILFNFFFFF